MKTVKMGLLFGLLLSLFGCSSAPKSVVTWRSDMKFQPMDDLSIAYKTYGDKNNPAVVLLHGIPTSSYLYRNIAPKVAEKGYYVITPDFIGFGASSKPESYDLYNNALQASRITQLLNQLHIDHYNLVTHDLGGLVGFELLTTDADKIDSFLVLNTTAYKEGFTPPKEMNMLAGWMGGSMSYMMSNRMTGRLLTGKFVKDNMGHPEKLSAEAKDNYWWPVHEGTTIPMRATAKSFDQIMDRYPVYQQALRDYKGRARILWGAKDKVLKFDALTPQFAKDLHLAKDKVQQAEDAGHFIQEDVPEVVTENILTLLAE